MVSIVQFRLLYCMIICTMWYLTSVKRHPILSKHGTVWGYAFFIVECHYFLFFCSNISLNKMFPPYVIWFGSDAKHGKILHNIWCIIQWAWWCHQMGTFSALLAICAGISPVTGEFPAQRPVTRSFDVFCAWINRWANHGEAGDLRRYRAHYDVMVKNCPCSSERQSVQILFL